MNVVIYAVSGLMVFSSFSKIKILYDEEIYFDVSFVSYWFNAPLASWILLFLISIIELILASTIYFKPVKKTYEMIFLIYGCSLVYSLIEFMILGMSHSYLLVSGNLMSPIVRAAIIILTFILYLANENK